MPELHTQSGSLRRQEDPSLSVRELYLHTEGSDPSEDQRMRTWLALSNESSASMSACGLNVNSVQPLATWMSPETAWGTGKGGKKFEETWKERCSVGRPGVANSQLLPLLLAGGWPWPQVSWRPACCLLS